MSRLGPGLALLLLVSACRAAPAEPPPSSDPPPPPETAATRTGAASESAATGAAPEPVPPAGAWVLANPGAPHPACFRINELVLVLDDGVPSVRAGEVARALGGAVIERNRMLNTYVLRVRAAALNELHRTIDEAGHQPGVASANLNVRTECPAGLASDPATIVPEPACGAGE